MLNVDEGYIVITKDLSASKQTSPYFTDPSLLSASSVTRIPFATLDVPVMSSEDSSILRIPVEGDMEKRFSRLARIWKAETGMLSRLDQICMHPAYQRIIGMGPAAIPFILQDLQETQAYWFWALTAITGEEPSGSETDDLDTLTKVWLGWGRKRGYIV
jgi:hypothetical protein